MVAYNGAPDAVDYSFSRADTARLATAGIKLVSRYLSHTDAKNLDAAEATDLLSHGVGILLNWESSAGRPAGGAANGTPDGRDAGALARTIGAPPTCGIAYSADWDVRPSEYGAVEAYLRAARAAHGVHLLGVYGHADLIDYLAARGVCDFYWQCFAWSGGRLSPHADLYQFRNGQTLAGATVDFDKIIHPAELGAWWPDGHAPSGGGTPIGDDSMSAADVAALKAWIHLEMKGTQDRVVAIEQAISDDTIAKRAAAYVGGAIADGGTGWNLPGLFAQIQGDLAGTKDRVVNIAAQPVPPTAVEIEAVVLSAVAGASGSDPAALTAAVVAGLKALSWRAA